MYATASVDRGDVIFPRNVRTALGLQEGDEVKVGFLIYEEGPMGEGGHFPIPDEVETPPQNLLPHFMQIDVIGPEK